MEQNMKHDNTIAIHEQGFTIIEAMTALALICACTVTIGSFLGSALKTTGQIRETLISTAALLPADEEIRRHMAAITIPYWERHVNVSHDSSRTVIPWYKGKENYTLEFIKTGDSFQVNAVTDTVFSLPFSPGFPGIRSVNLLRDGNGNPLGLDLAWEYRSGDIRTICRFSSSALVFAGNKGMNIEEH
jgi:hypothetical protein